MPGPSPKELVDQLQDLHDQWKDRYPLESAILSLVAGAMIHGRSDVLFHNMMGAPPAALFKPVELTPLNVPEPSGN